MVNFVLADPVKTRMDIAVKGYTLRGFASEIGISHSYLSQILNGQKNPAAPVATKISKGLQQPVDEIFLLKVVDGTTVR
ncbi:helix-turn-helix domain-containing protein [Bhargavaea beijingensis]|uniref:XRE family transcriptional regulator n=1 Tax=Bhargavaea beijingensis TaxID=426756 RepID=A0ABX9ZC96_9BACL|nr:helix-turn-helix transcriptional regulator [Bhargavaea beijingensis]RSK30982.1 XRE family transcriptional regulator [Bhargavaea beijingensis]